MMPELSPALVRVPSIDAVFSQPVLIRLDFKRKGVEAARFLRDLFLLTGVPLVRQLRLLIVRYNSVSVITIKQRDSLPF